jgi:F-type H+-transporting ATPase subunit b
LPRPPIGVLLAGGSPIDLDGSFFAQLAIFFVAFLILQHLVFRPVMQLFDARDGAMAGAKADADAMQRESEDKRIHLEAELQRVRQTAGADRERLRNEAQDLARKLADSARRESAATMEAARERLSREAEQARNRALAEAPQIAARIAERLLGRSAA